MPVLLAPRLWSANGLLAADQRDAFRQHVAAERDCRETAVAADQRETENTAHGITAFTTSTAPHQGSIER